MLTYQKITPARDDTLDDTPLPFASGSGSEGVGALHVRLGVVVALATRDVELVGGPADALAPRVRRRDFLGYVVIRW